VDNEKDYDRDMPCLTIDKPATYCIRVAGFVDKNWSDRLAGLEIVCDKRHGRKTVTTLCGTLIDQAALFGVLNALYDMRLPLLLVECVEIR
jgi:hypothetical protein